MSKSLDGDILRFGETLDGSWSLPGDPGYLETKAVFNALIDKNPGMVVFPGSHQDIIRSISFARVNGWKVSIKNGGHSTYGQCLLDDGLVLNMKYFNKVTVDSHLKIAKVKAGALLKDLDAACSPYHLAVPSGDCPMVGVTGLVLGGGNGFLSRSLGLTCDQLISAAMVTATGDTMILSDQMNQDVFRAIRGAGQGNFGVMTDLELRLSEVPKEVFGGSIYWPVSVAREVLRKYRDVLVGAPDALSLYIRLNQDLDDTPAIRLYGMFNGPVPEGERYFNPISQWSGIMHNTLGKYTYWEMQRINEQPSHFRPKFYWKNFFLKDLEDRMIDQLLKYFLERPNRYCRINLDVLGGKINRMYPLGTSFIHRDDTYICSIIGVWNNPEEEALCKAWCFNSWQDLTLGKLRSYQNYADPFQPDPPGSYFGERLDFLDGLKKNLDPEDLFMGTLTTPDDRT